jgi:hypothetical protein
VIILIAGYSIVHRALTLSSKWLWIINTFELVAIYLTNFILFIRYASFIRLSLIIAYVRSGVHSLQVGLRILNALFTARAYADTKL